MVLPDFRDYQRESGYTPLVPRGVFLLAAERTAHAAPHAPDEAGGAVRLLGYSQVGNAISGKSLVIQELGIAGG
jgi:hypothetical protein